MNKMQMAHDMALAMAANGDVPNENIVAIVWEYADAMQAEADERNKAEAKQKRKEVREILNDANTFIEREWKPDWSQAPEWAKYWMIASNGAADWLSDHPSGDPLKVKICHAPSFNYQGNWQDSLRKRPQ